MNDHFDYFVHFVYLAHFHWSVNALDWLVLIWVTTLQHRKKKVYCWHGPGSAGFADSEARDGTFGAWKETRGWYDGVMRVGLCTVVVAGAVDDDYDGDVGSSLLHELLHTCLGMNWTGKIMKINILKQKLQNYNYIFFE